MLAVNPYLNFNGNTEEAFNFYKSVFGGEFAMVQRFLKTRPSAAIFLRPMQTRLCTSPCRL